MAIKKCHLLVKLGNVIKKCYLKYNNINNTLIYDDSIVNKFLFKVNHPQPNTFVILTVNGVSTRTDTMYVTYDTVVEWEVNGIGYKPKIGQETITDTTVINVTLDEMCVFSVVPDQENADIVLEAEGYEQIDNTISVPSGTNVKYTVSKEHYETVGPLYYEVTQTYALPVHLPPMNYTLSIDPYPNDAVVEMRYGGSTYTTNSVTVPYQTNVEWTVSKTGWTTETGTFYADHNELNKEVNLTQLFTVEIIKTPVDAVVTFTVDGEEIVADSITVPDGTVVTYTVTKVGCNQVGPIDYTVTRSETLPVHLTPIMCTITIIPTPSTATVELFSEGYEQIDNSITVPFESNVRYIVSAEEFETVDSTILVTSSDDLYIKLRDYEYVDLEDYEYTNINYDLKLTKYIGTDTDVVVPNRDEVYHTADIVDYDYTNINYNLKLKKYIGTDTDVVVPGFQE